MSTTRSMDTSMTDTPTITVSIKDVEALKDQGNQAFQVNSYVKAIRLYEEGLKRA